MSYARSPGGDLSCPVLDEDLHAYVDRQLASDCRPAVERYLRDHAEPARRVNSYIAQREALRAALAGPTSEPTPAGLAIRTCCSVIAAASAGTSGVHGPDSCRRDQYGQACVVPAPESNPTPVCCSPYVATTAVGDASSPADSASPFSPAARLWVAGIPGNLS
jgi:hypothetical protein